MQPFLYFLLVLICPLGMGLMMWLMMHGRGHRKNDEGAAEVELARLRAEIAARITNHIIRPMPRGQISTRRK